MSNRLAAIRDGWCPPDLTYDELDAICAEWRNAGDSIAFTNGCFDVIHEGHLELLTAAREAGDRLIIALNPDNWVTRHKGPGRPLQRASIRRAVAHSLGRADLSIIFEDETAERLLSIIEPTSYIIGSDYRNQHIIGAEHCKEVVIMERLPGVSTTEIIARATLSVTFSRHSEHLVVELPASGTSKSP